MTRKLLHKITLYYYGKIHGSATERGMCWASLHGNVKLQNPRVKWTRRAVEHSGLSNMLKWKNAWGERTIDNGSERASKRSRKEWIGKKWLGSNLGDTLHCTMKYNTLKLWYNIHSVARPPSALPPWYNVWWCISICFDGVWFGLGFFSTFILPLLLASIQFTQAVCVCLCMCACVCDAWV